MSEVEKHRPVLQTFSNDIKTLMIETHINGTMKI